VKEKDKMKQCRHAESYSKKERQYMSYADCEFYTITCKKCGLKISGWREDDVEEQLFAIRYLIKQGFLVTKESK